MQPALESGDYARKQIYCPSRVVAWSHGSRSRLAGRLAAAAGGGRRLLDYGCGDGTFLALTQGTFAEAVGCDLDAAQLAECRRRLSVLDDVRFIHVDELASDVHTAAYDVVTCLEVLEHCVDAARRRHRLRHLIHLGVRELLELAAVEAREPFDSILGDGGRQTPGVGVEADMADRGMAETAVSMGISKEEFRRQALDAVPIKRILDPTEIAALVVYLASDASNFTTGCNLVVDGGYSL